MNFATVTVLSLSLSRAVLLLTYRTGQNGPSMVIQSPTLRPNYIWVPLCPERQHFMLIGKRHPYWEKFSSSLLLS